MFSKELLIRQIREMGIVPDDTVVIHTSLKAIGPVEGGADTVIDAFCQVLTEGRFLVPTHTWGVINRDNPHYDVRTTVPNIGALPRCAAFRTDGIRSLHPTHSVWAHGKDAAAFVAGEERLVTPAPPGSLWARIGDVGGKILLIGVGNDKNTFIHSVDELAELPDRLSADSYPTFLTDTDGRVTEGRMHPHNCSRCPDVSRNYVNFEPAFERLGAQSRGKLGNAEVRIVDAAQCRAIVSRIYRRAGSGDCTLSPMDIPEEWYLPECTDEKTTDHTEI
jgi:aminoglycoside 3-N-acetyltransferase